MKTLIRKLFIFSFCLAPLFISAQNEFYNDGASVYVQAAGLIYVQGEIINDDQGVNIGRIFNSGDIQLTGNWTNISGVSNVFQAFDPGTTTFLGNNALQTIGGTMETYFNNLTLNKPGGVREVRLLLNSQNDGFLRLNDDFLNTQTFIHLVSNVAVNAVQRTGPIVPNYTPSTLQGYVTSTGVGKFARATVPGITYFYPTGTAARFRPVEITSSALNAYGVRFVDAATPSTGLRAATLNTINPAWYHKMNRAAAGSPEVIRIYHDFVVDDICDINRVTMAEWNAAIWDDLSPTTSTNPGGGFLSWTQKAGYPGAYPTPWVTEDFAIAGLYITAPTVQSCVFPVEFTELKATPMESSILVNWDTELEINNAGFTLERSTNGIDFQNIGWFDAMAIAGGGASYSHNDREVVFNKVYFYRLRQVDFSGQEHLSNTVEAIIVKDQPFASSGFFPNPSNGATSLRIYATENRNLSVTLYNMIGQTLFERKIEVAEGENQIDFQFDLPAGNYQARLSGLGFTETHKLIVQH